MKHKGSIVNETLVIGIIVFVVVATLLPAFAKVGLTPHQQQKICMHNLKVLSNAMLMYAEDNGGVFCLPITYDGRHEYYWGNALIPYVKNLDTFVCPSDPQTANPARWFTDEVGTTVLPYSYCYNFFGAPDLDATSYGVAIWTDRSGIPAARSISDITEPSKTYLIGDATIYQGNSISFIYDYFFATGYHPDRGVTHDSGINIAYCDGHVAWMELEKDANGNIGAPPMDGFIAVR